MILKIYLLCYLCVMISSFPVTPSQTYPLYQANDYRVATFNPTTDFNSCLLQNTAQNAPTLTYQTDYRIPPSNPTNDINPYLLQDTAQNASPLDVKQILLNKILSRPSLQAILNPSALGYGLNEAATPSVINNYIILPMEYLDVNKTDINQDVSLKRVAETKTDNKSSKKDTKKKSKRKPRNEQDKDQLERDNDTPESADKDITTKKKEPSQKRERKNDMTNNRNERNSNKDGKKRKQRQNEVTETQDTAIANNKTESTIIQEPKRRKKNNKIDVNTTLTNDQNVNTEQITKTISPQVKNAENNTKKVTTTPESTNKVPKFAKSELTNDFLKTFPNIPQDMANSFMTGMNQFNDPQLTSFFSNYEQFYQSFIIGTQQANQRIKKRRKPRRNKRNRRRNQKNKSRNESNPTDSNQPSINEAIININPNKSANLDSGANTMRFKVTLNPVTVTTEKTKPTTQETQHYAAKLVNLDSIPIPDVPKSVETLSTIDDTAAFYNEALFDEPDATEDDENDEFDTPPIYYDIINDYYPLFTDDAVYANNVLSITSLDKDRLFYTSDDVENIEYEYPKRNIDDREMDTEIIEDKTERSIVDDEIQFRQPPLLEQPDFITRKVDRSEIKPNRFDDNIDLNDRVYVPDYKDKYSSYSNAKSSNVGANKQLRNKLNNDVETVYARSKVVKYGQKDSTDDDVNTQDVWDSFQNGETTYVIAKSLDSGEFW